MTSRADEHADGSLWPPRPRLPDQFHDTVGLSPVVVGGKGVKMDRSLFTRGQHRLRRFVPDGALGDIIVLWKDLLEYFVRALNDLHVRAIVRNESQGLRANGAKAEISRFQKKAHLGFAEAIDRLHRIADNENGSAVTRCPTVKQLR